MKTVPQIQKYMTTVPHTIGNDIPLKKAFEMMREYKVRHLPVLHAGKVVGIITDRDVKLASSFKGADEMTVDDVMTPDPYMVKPESPLDLTVKEMAARKLGCAVVQSNNKVVGIFTATDGLRVLGDVLEQNYKH